MLNYAGVVGCFYFTNNSEYIETLTYSQTANLDVSDLAFGNFDIITVYNVRDYVRILIWLLRPAGTFDFATCFSFGR